MLLICLALLCFNDHCDFIFSFFYIWPIFQEKYREITYDPYISKYFPNWKVLSKCILDSTLSFISSLINCFQFKTTRQWITTLNHECILKESSDLEYIQKYIGYNLFSDIFLEIWIKREKKMKWSHNGRWSQASLELVDCHYSYIGRWYFLMKTICHYLAILVLYV